MHEADKENKLKNNSKESLNIGGLITHLKFFLNVVKIQRSFRKYKAKCQKSIAYDDQLAKGKLGNIYSNSNDPLKKNSYKNYINENNNKIIGRSDEKVKNIFDDTNQDAQILNKNYNESKIKNGFGVQIWKDGAKFSGFFLNNKANGLGIFRHVDGDDYSVYVGEFLNDRANGFGSYKHSNGANYEGFWQDDAQEGYGIETWSDGSCYQGEYKRGKKNGFGIYRWADGSRYEGEWEENCLNGYGIYHFTDQRIFIGQWKNNSMHGYGEFKWNDGKKYVGYYKNDRKEGFGIYYWENPNKVYIGFWRNGKQDGVGKYITKEKIYYGLWNLGEKLKFCKDIDEAYMMMNAEQRRFFYLFRYELPEVKKFVEKI